MLTEAREDNGLYDIIHPDMDNEHPARPVLGNRYQLIETLGTGGMAVVYRARDLMLEREVAIKLLRQRFSRDPFFRDRFHQEAKAAANLSHPNIVTIYDFGLDNKRLFIVMEYIPGTDLKSIIRQRKLLSARETIGLMTQACFGIGYAHRVGLVHCDVKPQNMLVAPNQRLKVTDFGIARVLATIVPEEQHDIVWGSPLYFSPEQAAGEAPSPASDVYALGVILYEMTTGQMPFDSEDAVELLRLHREAVPILPRKINPDISPAFEQIILKVLSKKPSDRYSNADQLGRVLQALGNELGKTLSPSNSSSRPVRPIQSPSIAAPVTYSDHSQGLKPDKLTATTAPVEIVEESSSDDVVEMQSLFDIDFLSIGIGLVAALAVSGLIPFWIWIWYSIFMKSN
jgi:eukaryotic-like serine/threonine-protein kinase